LVGNIAEPLMTLIAFGFGLGALVGQVQGVPYILFLASGAICTSVMNAATFEALYSAFSRMHVQKTWEAIMNTPVELDDIVAAEMIWAALKGVFSGLAIVLVAVALDISREPLLLFTLPLAFVIGITFASMALIFNALARGYDFFTYYFSLMLTPMMFVSGVFFPREQLPEWLQTVAAILPLSHAVDVMRPLYLGLYPVNWSFHVLVMAAYAVGAFYLALVLTRKRFIK
jgi:lipooligosaccharide transport system permease protein